MKKFIYLLFILPILLLPKIVYGADNVVNGPAYGTDLLLPSYAIFMNNTGSSISRVSTTTASNGFYDYADYTTLANSYGGGIAFNTNNTLRGNSFYAFTIYVGMENNGTSLNSIYAVRSSAYDRVVVASSFDGLIDRYSRNDYNAIHVTSKDFLNPVIVKNSSSLENFSGVIQYIIKVGSDGGNFIFIPYTTNQNFYNRHIFFGYSIDFLGSQDNGITTQDVKNAINSSGLATASSVSEVNQSTNQIKQEISGMQQEQQQTNQKLDDLNDNITSEEEPEIDLTLDETSNTPISDLILFPINLLNKLINTIGSDTCSPYTLPFFYDTTITFPCFQLSNYLGSDIVNAIDLFICLFMCYNLAMLFISIFEDITSLRDTYDSLYEPKHAYTGYKPKHGKE